MSERSVYCAIATTDDAHRRCPGGRCNCPCHRKRKEPTVVAESVICPECGRRCGNGTGLASHLRSMHPEAARRLANEVMAAPTPSVLRTPTVPPPTGRTVAAPGLVWEEPPASGRGPRAIADAVKPLIIELRRNPGRWARIHTYKGGASASGSMKRMREAFPDIEFTGRRLADGGSAMYARFPEEG